MSWTKRDTIVCLVLACIAGFLFIPFLGRVHLFDWDEINFAEIAREMILTGDYFRVHIDFQPFWEKPPLFFWLQVLSMKIFGVNEFAARFPNALLGVLTLPVLYALGKNLSGRGNFGLLWALCYGGSFLPAFYFKSGIIDPLFNFWILLSIYALSSYYAPVQGKVHSMRRVAIAGVAIGLALLTKGPVAVLLAGLTWFLFWLWRRRFEDFPLTEIAVYCALALAVSFAWYGVELLRNGVWFFREFTQYQIRLLTTGDAGHSQPWYYHSVVLLIGCFPASVLIFPALKALRTVQNALQNRIPLETFTLWMVLLLTVVLVVFSAVQTKIVHYSSLAYFPITFLAARTLDSLVRKETSLSRLVASALLALGGLWVLLLALVPILGMNMEWVVVHTKDAFVRGNLQANVVWSGWELCIAIGYALALAGSGYFLATKRYFEMTFTLFPATALALVCFTTVIAPKIEAYSQRAAVEFYEGLQGQKCYVRALGFKTYADLFYSHKNISQSASALNIPPEDFEQWLLEGDIDKPAYFVCKIQDAAQWRKHPNLTELYEKNGFVFLKRDTKKPSNLASGQKHQ